VNWSACQFPRSDKWDQSSTWRSANSTRSVVGFCSCCLTRAHVEFQLPLDVLGTDVTASCSPLPPAVRRESNYRKRLSAVSAAEMCGWECFRERERRRVRVCTLLPIRAYVCRRVRRRGQCRCDMSVNAPATLYSASAADTNATLRYVADTCKSLCL